MSADRLRLLIFLSDRPERARPEFQEILAEHPHAHVTVYLRRVHREQFEDLLDGVFVYEDKPRHTKLAFIRELRAPYYDRAIVLDFGTWDFYPARCLFFLCRAREKIVRSERGSFRFSPLAHPLVLWRHLLYRRNHRSGSVAGLPSDTPLPFPIAVYRKTIGLTLGIVWTVAEFSWRRLRSLASGSPGSN